MADTTKGNVLAIASQLSSFSNTTWDLILDDVAGDVTEAVFGAKQEKAQRYLAAHCLTLIQLAQAGGAGASGAMTSQKVGDVKIDYGDNISDFAFTNRLDETPYGRKFNDIRNGCILAFNHYTP